MKGAWMKSRATFLCRTYPKIVILNEVKNL
jgi:hypothetical protein